MLKSIIGNSKSIIGSGLLSSANYVATYIACFLPIHTVASEQKVNVNVITIVANYGCHEDLPINLQIVMVNIET